MCGLFQHRKFSLIVPLKHSIKTFTPSILLISLGKEAHTIMNQVKMVHQYQKDWTLMGNSETPRVAGAVLCEILRTTILKQAMWNLLNFGCSTLFYTIPLRGAV